MNFEGPAVVVPGVNVDTDVLYPGAYLNVDDPETMRQYLFEGLDPSLRDRLIPGCIVVVGDNFGSGSSREHVVFALKAFGVSCVVGVSFARIFYRNCFNLGLPAIACPDAAEAATNGAMVRVDVTGGRIEVDGTTFAAPPVPDFMLNMLERGGLVEWSRARLTSPA